MQPKWSILIPTTAAREDRFLDLLGVLLPQAEARLGAGYMIEVVALRNCGGLSLPELGQLRQALLEDARGEFLSFVDDDDMVEQDFIPAVLEAIGTAPVPPDYVAFRHAYYEGGQRDPRPVITGLQHGGWADTPVAMYRPVTHINPVRAELARNAGFHSTEGPEDYPYDVALSELLRGRPQAEVQRVLYHYRHNWQDSVQAGSVPRLSGTPLPPVSSPCFRWHPWSGQ